MLLTSFQQPFFLYEGFYDPKGGDKKVFSKIKAFLLMIFFLMISQDEKTQCSI
jgi:hypothetical protein